MIYINNFDEYKCKEQSLCKICIVVSMSTVEALNLDNI